MTRTKANSTGDGGPAPFPLMATGEELLFCEYAAKPGARVDDDAPLLRRGQLTKVGTLASGVRTEY